MDCTALELIEAMELLANAIPVSLTDYQCWRLGIEEGKEITAQDLKHMIATVTSEGHPVNIRLAQ